MRALMLTTWIVLFGNMTGFSASVYVPGLRVVLEHYNSPVRANVSADALYLNQQNKNHGFTGYGAGRPGSATNTHSCDHIRAVPSQLRSAQHMYPSGLGNFYQKYTEAYGIPVLGSNALSDSALQRACYTVRFLLADVYAVRNSYYKMYGRFALMGVNEVTVDIPEHTSLGTWWNQRARGLGATKSRPVATGGEENALCLNKDRYRSEDILLHEFAHGVHLLGASYALANFDTRLKSLYNSAKAAGKWANTYSMSTDHEYFAEGVQSYYGVNAHSDTPNGVHGPISTREKLRSYDPPLYNLIREVFPCDNTYIKRCQKDRIAEMSQNLRINCNGGGGGTSVGGGSTGGGSGGDTKNNCKDVAAKCSTWAADGWCTRCSAYMNTNCMKSCNKCSTTGGGNTNCVDNNKHCASWAANGECTKNPGYMLPNCKKSCKRC